MDGRISLRTSDISSFSPLARKRSIETTMAVIEEEKPQAEKSYHDMTNEEREKFDKELKEREAVEQARRWPLIDPGALRLRSCYW
jgi:hypothetical protein